MDLGKQQQQLSLILISLVDILGTGAWRGLSRVPVSGSFSGADMISGIKDRLIWRYYDVARGSFFLHRNIIARQGKLHKKTVSC